MKDFEKSRIKTLQQERINVQKKTFTKWCNSFLSKVTAQTMFLKLSFSLMY